MRSRIIGTGSEVPQKIVTNDDLSKTIDTSDEWIRTRTGIRERRVSDEKTATSDLAFAAARKAMSAANFDPEKLELIIVATCSPDTLFPSTACILQSKLKASSAAAFDLSAACSGFNFALSTAQAYIESKMYNNVLVVGADTLTKYLDWSDRSTCVLFGDGAGAVLLEKTEEEKGVLASYIKAKGDGGNHLVMPGGGSRDPEEKSGRFIRMDGKEVFKFAVKALEESVVKVLEKANLSLGSMDLLIPHQANMRIIEHVVKKFSLPEKKVYVNLMKYGNTSAASIPLALDEAVREGRIKPKDIVVLSGFGAGLTYGSNIICWG
ncbi:MAG: 3-oxoacyl-acyl-carrier-protein synthase III [Candidatus Saganbacteria bacterium]|uniref:Beta-ketoacyl-[acyl-carrier-protein] synthase III n=1 Tax=Candidatus Saganbacteria bacterium TaxID=2575572 RepID=A0A833NRV2_UNCSA|nr:MAG: 3-oxoacyl-acyl-carrier-protein synthase III [Candidatus Saganbacteria bacterium]